MLPNILHNLTETFQLGHYKYRSCGFYGQVVSMLTNLLGGR
jgi:hypothetical protein